jgi:YbbR domain-containing protein
MRWLGDAGSLVLSLALALVVWLAATQAAVPMRNQTFGSDDAGLPITVAGLAPGLSWHSASASAAAVTLRGSADGLAAVTADGLAVRADLSKVRGAGVYTVPLAADCPACAGRPLRVASIAPPALTVTVEVSAERAVAVEAALKAPGSETCRGVDARFAPATVEVSGAASRVALARRAVVAVGDSPLTGPVEVIPVDASGRRVADVAIVPGTVEAAVTLVPLDTCAEVAVLPVYGAPPAGYYVAGIEVVPDHVQLRGEPELLAPYRDDAVVMTERIDISQSRESAQRLVALDIPRGLEIVGAGPGVTVTIRVGPVPGTRSVEVALSPTDVPDGLRVDSLSPTRVAVLLSGPAALLETLDVNAIRGLVTLGGLAPGTHRLAPTLELPASVRIRSIAPAEVEVRLVQD